MPYTLSHAAAVVPAYRPLARAGMYSAALIGSMAPDFGMLLPQTLARWQTHSAQALFSFCLPLGLIAYWITQLLIKPALVQVLPDGQSLRLQRQHPVRPIRALRSWGIAVVGILAGAVTHLIWDGFTHEDARGVRMFSVLDDYGPAIAGHPLQLYRWLQYGSSVLGLLVLVLALWLWWRHAPPSPQPRLRALGPLERGLLLAAYGLLPLVAVARSLGYAITHRAIVGYGYNALLGRPAIALLRGGAAALIVVSAVALALALQRPATAAGAGTGTPVPPG